jgi:hypothetical protein
MRITPKTEEQLIEEKLWPDGIYRFQITKAEETKSKKQNEMIKVYVNVYDDENNRVQIIWDYLMETMHLKLIHAVKACGLQEQYDTGVLSDYHFTDKTGYVELYTEDDETYGKKNKIKDYVKPENIPTEPPKETLVDDEVPF